MRALITGSTQGIGLAMAKAFVARGDEVIIHCSKDLSKAERVKEELGAYMAVTADLSSEEQARELYQKTGAVDLLILNASVQYKEAWDQASTEHLDEQIQVNFKSTLFLMQAYAPSMKSRSYGRIVTVGSVNQHRTHPQLSIYSATKCAVMSLVKNVAKDLAPYGVTVNNLSPGAVATPRNAAVLENEQAKAAVVASIPLGRVGLPEECVGAALLLCSPQGAYITGADIQIDGGMSL